MTKLGATKNCIISLAMTLLFSSVARFLQLKVKTETEQTSQIDLSDALIKAYEGSILILSAGETLRE